MSAAGVKRGVRNRVAALFAVLVLAVTAACTGGQDSSPSPSTSSRGGGAADVLAVKIDNVAPARPHTGLEEADIVYVEQVEAGLSRILAVYSSDLPPVIGPVRSARETDLELLRQFDRPTLAFSGAQSRLLPVIDRAPVDAVPPSKAPRAYFRGPDRPAPHNLYLRPERIPFTASGVDAVAELGLRVGAPPPGGEPEDSRTVRYPSASVTFTWSAEGERWLVSLDGSPARTAEGERIGAGTVVVQDVDVRESDFRDRSGNNTPFTETVGAGDAVVLRDGRAYEARWSRSSADADTVYSTPDGRRVDLAEGPLWILYAPRG
ncbi:MULTISPECIES: DUF3048 domain-containing protein [unclassified Streptomyces]|uniref:DUF3048 domain-containing protein n=1 Tax=unclassified Streptomyces TaxID=2593676 RepID=UPI000B50E335|nr:MULTISPECIES: DUF3048 domain-containing protein [unclassified Streptomyces]MYX03940.1 DUF3048 domain-containing protein [Streptomyces sp. SID8378]SNB88907.1 Protein of unknown function [Streptomyces sp. PgraA7]